ncbi:Flp family type IVb pilin [Parasalinivibrio latis]|uniref:Flp family type IVb pilin n=1 Tax=Parasalinivibrio latis TaxID=2952610 RepID=UPI0030E324A4
MCDLLLKAWIKTRLALENYASDNRGVTAIEYAVIAVAVTAIVIAAFGSKAGSPLYDALVGAIGKVTTQLGAFDPKPGT